MTAVYAEPDIISRRWPRGARTVPLGALLTLPGYVRSEVEYHLSAWGLQVATDSAKLLASEIVSNAVRASTTPDGPMYLDGRMAQVQFGIYTDFTDLLMVVWDEAPGVPVLRQAGATAESGHGLEIVDVMSRGRWGYQQVRGGKIVWAQIEVPTA
jgi:hypothetical protein